MRSVCPFTNMPATNAARNSKNWFLTTAPRPALTAAPRRRTSSCPAAACTGPARAATAAPAPLPAAEAAVPDAPAATAQAAVTSLRESRLFSCGDAAFFLNASWTRRGCIASMILSLFGARRRCRLSRRREGFGTRVGVALPGRAERFSVKQARFELPGKPASFILPFPRGGLRPRRDGRPDGRLCRC